jgi:hypothetical protein
MATKRSTVPYISLLQYSVGSKDARLIATDSRSLLRAVTDPYPIRALHPTVDLVLHPIHELDSPQQPDLRLSHDVQPIKAGLPARAIYTASSRSVSTVT